MTKIRRHRTLLIALAALIAGATVGGVQFAMGASPGTATSTVPVEPYRILDTRLGIGSPTAPLTAGQTIDVQIAGVGPVPADAIGVVLNLTGTRTTQATYITAWPAGGIQPTASVLNLTPGIDAPNTVTALLGTGGKLSLFNFTGSTDLIADVAGYLVPAGGGAQGPQGPQGVPGPQGPAPFAIDTTVASGTSVLGIWEGVTISGFCSGSQASLTLSTSGSGLRMGAIASTPSIVTHLNVPGAAQANVGPFTSSHVTGMVRSTTTVGARLLDVELHAFGGAPCRFWGTVLPVG